MMTQVTADGYKVTNTDPEARAAPASFKIITGLATEDLSDRVTEGGPFHCASRISVMFSQWNKAFSKATEAERAQERGNGNDPAVDPLVREAEHAWRVVSDLREALHDAPVTCASDRTLLSMARIADAVMDSDNLTDFGAADNRLRAATFFRQRLGRGHVPPHVTRLLDECHAHLSAVFGMGLYQPVCDPDDLPDAAWNVLPEAC